MMEARQISGRYPDSGTAKSEHDERRRVRATEETGADAERLREIARKRAHRESTRAAIVRRRRQVILVLRIVDGAPQIVVQFLEGVGNVLQEDGPADDVLVLPPHPCCREARRPSARAGPRRRGRPGHSCVPSSPLSCVMASPAAHVTKAKAKAEAYRLRGGGDGPSPSAACAGNLAAALLAYGCTWPATANSAAHARNARPTVRQLNENALRRHHRLPAMSRSAQLALAAVSKSRTGCWSRRPAGR